MKVLVDNSVLSDGQILEPFQEHLAGFANKLALYRARPRKTTDAAWKQEQIECLPTIARLASDGWLELCVYDELRLERSRARESFGGLGGNLFAKLSLSHLAAPIRRGLFQQSSFERFNQSKALNDFVEWLTKFYNARFLEAPVIKDAITSFERDNLNNIELLRARCSKIEKTHFADAFHIWAGDVHQIPYFLTTDRKLINLSSKNPKLFSLCSPISPNEFLAELGVVENDEFPFEYGKKYLIDGKEY